MFPWNQIPLNNWDIVEMCHCQIGGRRCLSVLMTDGENIIKSEGEDDAKVWADLKVQAELAAMPEALTALY